MGKSGKNKVGYWKAMKNINVNKNMDKVARDAGFKPVKANSSSDTPGHMAYVNDSGVRIERWHTGTMHVQTTGSDGKKKHDYKYNTSKTAATAEFQNHKK